MVVTIVSNNPPRPMCQMGKHCLKGGGKSGEDLVRDQVATLDNCLLFSRYKYTQFGDQ